MVMSQHRPLMTSELVPEVLIDLSCCEALVATVRGSVSTLR
jgi:hypothetical protein